MQKTSKLRIAILLLMLVAAGCVLIGWETEDFTIMKKLTYYRGALFPSADPATMKVFFSQA